MALQLGIFLGLVLSVFHFVWESMAHKLHPYRKNILSFGFGVSASYVFMQLLPDLYTGISELNNGIFVVVLIGFTIMHLIELYSFKLTESKRYQFKKEVAFEHSVAFFIYHFMLGVILVNFIKISVPQGIFFFAPLLFYTVVSSLSLAEIDEKVSRNAVYKILLSSSSLLGTIAATYFFTLDIRQFYTLLAFITGSILYVIVRDTVPRYESGRPLWFIAGVLLYMLTSVYYWRLGGVL
jgi:hypothetical protein